MNDPLPHPIPPGGPAPSRRAQLVELAVFLFLIVPAMSLSYFSGPERLTFTYVATASIINDLALFFLVLYFVWRSGESFAMIGLRVTEPAREVVLGALLFIPFIMFVGILEAFLQKMGLSAPSGPQRFLAVKGGLSTALGVLLVVVVAIAEETIFRGYLILRFTQVTGRIRTAVLLSTVIFAFGHGYEGTAGVVTVGVIGLIFALVYLRRGNLVAAMTLHFLQDFVSVVLAPLAGK